MTCKPIGTAAISENTGQSALSSESPATRVRALYSWLTRVQASTLRRRGFPTSRAMPRSLHATLHALRPAPKPSCTTPATSRRQASQPRMPRLAACTRRYCSGARWCAPRNRRWRPLQSGASDLAVRSFLLANGAAVVAREGRRLGRKVPTLARRSGSFEREGEDAGVRGSRRCGRRRLARGRTGPAPVKGLDWPW